MFILDGMSIKIELLPVHGVKHLNGDQHGQSHGHWVRIVEDLAVNSLEFGGVGYARQVVSL